MGENGETLSGCRHKKGTASAREGDDCVHGQAVSQSPRGSGHDGSGIVDGDKSLPSVRGSVEGGCSGSQGDKGKGTVSAREISVGMDPVVAFFMSVRMETTSIVSTSTREKESSFTFPLVMDISSSSFNDFRANICAKYPWGLFDAVEIRYWDNSKESWNPLQCDDELGLMFARNAQTRSCNLEIIVIQRKRGERCEKTPASRTTVGGTIRRRRGRPCASKPGASSTPSAPSTSAASASSSPTAPSVTLKPDDQPDPVVHEALPYAPILCDEEDEKLYPGYVQQNNEEHGANEDYIPAEFSDSDEGET
ncbi:hypothetical protein ZWY2020_023402 [Hordeum vulgare]|nr:hypothetical protein ZWY2020_023402 [Hordeum vulgare]